MSFSPDGSRIVTGSGTRRRRCGTRGPARTRSTSRGTPRRQCGSFSPDGARIVTGSGDGTAKVWDARTGTPVTSRGTRGRQFGVAFRPDGARIVTGSRDRTAKVWDARTGTPLLASRGTRMCARSASVQPGRDADRHRQWDATAKVWDARTGTEILTLKGHTTLGIPAGLHAPGGLIEDPPLEGVIRRDSAPTAADRHRQLGPDGEGVGRADRCPTPHLKGHTLDLFGEFLPGRHRIVTGSADGTAKVWDAQSGAHALRSRATRHRSLR